MPLLITMKITFGMAPVVMLYCLGLRTMLDQLILIFYVLCGIARLARFNVAAHLAPKDINGRAIFHAGLPIPYAALLITTVVAVGIMAGWTSVMVSPQPIWPDSSCAFHPASVVMMAVSTAMISKRFQIKVDLAMWIPGITASMFLSCWLYPQVVNGVDGRTLLSPLC